MKNTIKTFVAVALSAACLIDCSADWAENQFVSVSCEHPDVEVMEFGDDFYVLAPGKPETFYADVMVNAITGWQLLQPAQSQLPLRMCGGSSVRYKVAKPPESEKSGMIYFHNYIIRSNHADGAKNIVVPAGANVIYTAYRDGDSRESNWSVKGEDKRGYSSIVFNRNWWYVPSWFAGTMTTPRPDTYSIRGNDVDFITLYDTGEMKVIGIRQIALSGGVKSSDRIEPPGEGETWQETEVIYSEPCAVFDLTATLWPDTTTAEEYAKIKDNISWTFASGRIERDESNPLHATCHSPSQPGEYIVTASCGTASRIILVKVGTYKIQEVTFHNNIAIKKDVTSETYTGYDWRDDNLDGISDMGSDANARSDLHYHPIAYLSTNTSSATGTFHLFCKKVSEPTKHISHFDVEAAVKKVRFAWNDSFWGWGWSTSANYGNGSVTLTASHPFESSPKVRYDAAAELAWEVGFGEQNAQDGDLFWFRSSSHHELHLTYRHIFPTYETIFYLSCLNASGSSSDSSVTEGIWHAFTGRDVKLKCGTLLHYYKSFRCFESKTTEWLITSSDGNCEAWVDIMQRMLSLHGIESEKWQFVVNARVLPAEGFMVKQWRFEGNGTSGDSVFPYKNSINLNSGFEENEHIGTNCYNWLQGYEVNYSEGFPAQNNIFPAALFQTHYIVKACDGYYDPSYGVKYSSFASWDFDDNLSGFMKKSGDCFFFKKNPMGDQMKLIRVTFSLR